MHLLFLLWFPLTCAHADVPSTSGVRGPESAPVAVLASHKVTLGGTTALNLAISRAQNPHVHWEGKDLPLFSCTPEGPLTTFISASMDMVVGPKMLEVSWEGEGSPLHLPIEVVDKAYPQERLSVDPKLAKPSPEMEAQLKVEGEKIRAIYDHPGPVEWTGGFRFPVGKALASPLGKTVTSPFGTRRLFNGETKSYHSGLDLRGNEKTPVHAANSGTVRWAGPRVLAGNSVLMDHGAGVYSIYSHLSRIEVAEGHHLKKGAVLGYVGSTGRVTGPHLHWTLVVHGSAVDPIPFMKVFAKVCR